MKKIPINAFREGQEIYFDIGRLSKLEAVLGKPIGSIVGEQSLSITNLCGLLSVGLAHYGHSGDINYYKKAIQDALENGHDLAEIQGAVVKALVGSRVLGNQAYYALWPEEKTDRVQKKIEEEKVAEETAKN